MFAFICICVTPTELHLCIYAQLQMCGSSGAIASASCRVGQWPTIIWHTVLFGGWSAVGPPYRLFEYFTCICIKIHPIAGASHSNSHALSLSSCRINHLMRAQDFISPPWIAQRFLFHQIHRAAELRFQFLFHLEKRINSQVSLWLEANQKIQIAIWPKIIAQC